MSNRTNDNDRPQFASSQGRPSTSKQIRNARRLTDYREKKNVDRDWSTAIEVREQGDAIVDTIRQKKSNNPRNVRKTPSFLDEKPSTVATPHKNDLLYDGEARGSVATIANNSHNLDFSAFPHILDTVYEGLCNKDPRLRRSLPFCAFQHYYTEILNATIIQRVMSLNRDNRFAGEMDPFDVISAQHVVIPAPIHDYINGIGKAVLQNGDMIHVNLPTAAIPQYRIDPVAENYQYSIPSGSFGAINADNHNAYECYVSPFITSALIEHTLVANDGRNFGDWNPFPEGSYPVNATCTPNLLGYRLPERLTNDGMNVISGLTFTNDNTMAGRLRHSPELFARVGAVMTRYTQDFEFRVGVSEPTPNPSVTVVSTVYGIVPHTQALANTHGTLTSCEGFGSSTANQAFIFSYKRDRTENAGGLCMLTSGEAPANWLPTRNNNFHMYGLFTPIFGSDFPHLRTNRFHEEALSGTRSDTLRQWLSRHFVRKR